MKISNKLKALVIAGAVVVAGVATTAQASAVTCPAGSKRAGEDVSSLAQCNVDPDPANGGLMNTVNTIISVILGVVGFIAVVMIIIGGISYTTSAGDASKVKKAKDTILYGVVGLVIALLAFAIVNFVLTSVF